MSNNSSSSALEALAGAPALSRCGWIFLLYVISSARVLFFLGDRVHASHGRADGSHRGMGLPGS